MKTISVGPPTPPPPHYLSLRWREAQLGEQVNYGGAHYSCLIIAARFRTDQNVSSSSRVLWGDGDGVGWGGVLNVCRVAPVNDFTLAECYFLL